ncbi:MAG: hypothetical protein M1834_003623 [Cirrosporium novae-zelandiae]|nr:MAG: hypothetical protein M1834_003623 [Cirrosporium novae-zelandiae]
MPPKGSKRKAPAEETNPLNSHQSPKEPRTPEPQKSPPMPETAASSRPKRDGGHINYSDTKRRVSKSELPGKIINTPEVNGTPVRKRGRPKKQQVETEVTSTSPQQKRKRGRPSKADSTTGQPASKKLALEQPSPEVSRRRGRPPLNHDAADTPRKAGRPKTNLDSAKGKAPAKPAAKTSARNYNRTAPKARGAPDPDDSDMPRASMENSHPENADDDLEDYDGPMYWLFKSEPETRMEGNKDVRFSISDLEACTEPEPWEGIRNPVARNNMRLMREGELGFFYHSNCKVPGIVGTVKIVKEHEPDPTAFDPKSIYYDPKSNPSKPKWDQVHVEFHSKFDEKITLTELKSYSHPGEALSKLETLVKARLSVSRVKKSEWDFIMSLVMDDIEVDSEMIHDNILQVETSAKEANVQEANIQEANIQETIAEEIGVQETTTKETNTEESNVQETTAEETTVKESNIQEMKAQETIAETRTNDVAPVPIVRRLAHKEARVLMEFA